ncbi:Os10g0481050 [Oryza sativa Japonica Group]|uniref:Os10g0481050 protein n=1 Tax=Oryza sativa subsp. japonica TaxID=39947 RepID=A0A0P0XVH7_ORYSJ|nr:Os10g0481050 [Oryza sativa Japonica Group]
MDGWLGSAQGIVQRNAAGRTIPTTETTMVRRKASGEMESTLPTATSHPHSVAEMEGGSGRGGEGARKGASRRRDDARLPGLTVASSLSAANGGGGPHRLCPQLPPLHLIPPPTTRSDSSLEEPRRLLLRAPLPSMHGE